jgi:AP-3 complex subunit delta
MFEKSLQDLIKAIRAARPENLSGIISKAIQEIKDELKSRDVTIKAQALQKLCYVSAVAAVFFLCRA